MMERADGLAAAAESAPSRPEIEGKGDGVGFGFASAFGWLRAAAASRRRRSRSAASARGLWAKLRTAQTRSRRAEAATKEGEERFVKGRQHGLSGDLRQGRLDLR